MCGSHTWWRETREAFTSSGPLPVTTNLTATTYGTVPLAGPVFVLAVRHWHFTFVDDSEGRDASIASMDSKNFAVGDSVRHERSRVGNGNSG